MQLEAFRISGDELAALRSLALIAEVPRDDWPSMVECAVAEGIDRLLAAFADVAAGLAAGTRPMPDPAGWQALRLETR